MIVTTGFEPGALAHIRIDPLLGQILILIGDIVLFQQGYELIPGGDYGMMSLLIGDVVLDFGKLAVGH